jgi:hypothetical protein
MSVMSWQGESERLVHSVGTAGTRREEMQFHHEGSKARWGWEGGYVTPGISSCRMARLLLVVR